MSRFRLFGTAWMCLALSAERAAAQTPGQLEDIAVGYQAATLWSSAPGHPQTAMPAGWTVSATHHLSSAINFVVEASAAKADAFSRYSVLGGRRSGGVSRPTTMKPAPFFQFQAGVSHQPGRTGLLVQPGVGVDFRHTRMFGSRLNVDYVYDWAKSESEKGLRLAVSIVLPSS